MKRFSCLTTALVLSAFPGGAWADSAEVIAQGLRQSAFTRVQVFGAPRVKESFGALTPTDLDEWAEQRFEFDPRAAKWKAYGLAVALRKSKPLSAPDERRSFNYRWGCAIYSGSSKIHALYLDQLVNDGTVDGEPYHFGPVLRLWFRLLQLENVRWLGISGYTWLTIGFFIFIGAAFFALLRRLRRRRPSHVA